MDKEGIYEGIGSGRIYDALMLLRKGDKRRKNVRRTKSWEITLKVVKYSFHRTRRLKVFSLTNFQSCQARKRSLAVADRFVARDVCPPSLKKKLKERLERTGRIILFVMFLSPA